MLSEKFKTVIYQILDDKENAKLYDMTTTPNHWEYSNSYSHFYQALRQLEILNTQNNFGNYINNGILDSNVLNNGKKAIRDHYIENLKYLDYFSPENQNIINTCLDMSVDLKMFENVTLNNSEWRFFLLQLYINKLLQKIFFVWKKNMLYMPDIMLFSENCKKYNINYTPLDNYNTVYWNIVSSCEKLQYNDLCNLLTFLNQLFQKYKDVNVFVAPVATVPVATVPVPTKPLSKFIFEDLCKLKVDGLKDLCIKNNIKMKSGAKRDDYEKALLKI